MLKLHRHCRTFVIVFLFTSTAVAQQTDTSVVRALHAKAVSFLSTYPDSLLFYRDSSFSVAVQLNDPIGIAESYTDLGIYHWLSGNYADAIQAYDTSNYLYDHVKMPDKKSGNLSNLGMVYSRLGDFPKAIRFFLASLRLAEAQNNKERQAKIYNSLGVVYKNQNNFREAASAYSKAINLFKELGQAESVAGCYTNMGNISSLEKDYAKGLTYHQKALVIFDSLQSFRGMVACYNNLSHIYLAKENLADALRFSERALVLSRSKGFFSSEVNALYGMASVRTAMGELKTAERSYLEAIQLAQQHRYKTEMVNLYQGLSACYKKMKRHEDALRFFERYASLKDSLFNEQNLVTISNLQMSYDLERKEASIQLLKKDNEITRLSRNRMLLAAMAMLIVATLIVLWQRSKIRNHREIHSQQKKLHETEQALTRAELESERLKGEELVREIAYKNKVLTTYALSMVQKNEILEEVKESIELMIQKPDNQPEHFKKLSRVIDYGFSLDKDWDDFKLYFEEVHHHFFAHLCENYPDLSGADLKLCALIRLNMNVKQSAAILRISPDSVKVARHRLRKKFDLQTEDNLTSFIMSL